MCSRSSSARAPWVQSTATAEPLSTRARRTSLSPRCASAPAPKTPSTVSTLTPRGPVCPVRASGPSLGGGVQCRAVESVHPESASVGVCLCYSPSDAKEFRPKSGIARVIVTSAWGTDGLSHIGLALDLEGHCGSSPQLRHVSAHAQGALQIGFVLLHDTEEITVFRAVGAGVEHHALHAGLFQALGNIRLWLRLP